MTTCTMTKTTSGSYKAVASYTINEEHNGVEISFTEKPGDIIRDELKKQGFRWHSAKKVWYAKKTAQRVQLAERLANRDKVLTEEKKQTRAKAEKELAKVQTTAEAAPLVIPSAKFVDGGGLYDGWEGGNNKTWHTDQELKALLLADFKRAGIAATIRFNRAGYLTSLTVTIKISAAEIKPFDEWGKDFHVVAGRWNYYTDEVGKIRDIYGESYYTLPEAEQAAMFENIKRTHYNLAVAHLTENGNCHGREIDVLTEAGNAKYKTVQAIVDSYNRDCSNSMVDYFDRDIYDHYTFKVA